MPLELIDVLLAVDPEAQGIAGLELAVVLLPAAGIDHDLDPGLGRHPEVVLAARADPKVGVEIRLVQRGVAALALRPNPFRDGLFGLLCEPLRARPPGHGPH